MSKPLTLEIREVSKSLNMLNKMHWKAKWHHQRLWDELVMVAKAGKRWVPPERARVTITRHSPGVLEFDNFIGGTKYVTDALRLRYAKGKLVGGNHIIKDDNAAHLEHGEHRQVKCKKGQTRTVIVIEELKEADSADK